MATISIIIVTYNSSAYIRHCLDSIFSQGFKDFEVIVIDNASSDETREIIKCEYPDVVLIENLENFGPCKARNQAIAKASGTFILFLDHDIKLENNFLVNIYKAIRSQDFIGAAGPRIMLGDNKTIYSAGIYHSWLWRFYDIGSSKKNIVNFEQKKYVFGISAAAAIYRREALEAIKQGNEYFDESFFYFFEDVDISWRLQKRGRRILYTPDAVCTHLGGRSRHKDKVSQYLCMRNRYFTIIKNDSLLSLLRFPLVFISYDLWRNAYMLITNPRLFFKALCELGRFAPKIIMGRLKDPSNKYEN